MISLLIVSSLSLFAGLHNEATLPKASAIDGGLEQDSLLVRYDLGPVLPSFDQNAGWTHGLNRGFETAWGEANSIDIAGIYERAAPEAITELIKQILGDELYAEGRMVSLEGESSLLVLAPAAIQARVSAAIEALATGLGAAIGLQIDVVELKGGLEGDTPSELSRDGAERYLKTLQARNGVRHTYQVDLSAGRTAIIDQISHKSMVLDYDIEIAQGSLTYDPIVFQMEEGEQFLLQAVPYLSGSSLSVIMTSSQLVGEIKETELSLPGYVGHEESGRLALMKGTGMLQQAQLQQRCVASSAFLGSDQALVYASQASQAGTDVSRVVVLRQTSASGLGFKRVNFPGSPLSLLLVNASVFDSSPFSFGVGYEWSGSQWWTPRLLAKADTNHSAFLFEWAQRHFQIWRRVGPWAAIVTNPEWDGQAASDLERLMTMAGPADRQVSVDLEFGRTSGSLSPMRWSLPMLVGSHCGVLLGNSSTALVDLDVEVASDANAKDPVMAAVFHGISAELGISGQGAQRFVSLRGAGRWIDMPAINFDLGSFQGAQFDQTRTRSMIFDHSGMLPEGKALRLGATGESIGNESGLYLQVSAN